MASLSGRLEYDYNLFRTKKNSFEAFFQNHAFILNAEVPFRLNRAHSFSLGATVNISAAAEESNQPVPSNISSISARRNEYEVYLAYSAILTRSFSSTLSVVSWCDSIGREAGMTLTKFWR